MKCPLASSKAVGKKNGVFTIVIPTKNIVWVQWNDNQVVYMASIFIDVQPIKAVKRFSPSQKRELMFLSLTAS